MVSMALGLGTGRSARVAGLAVRCIARCLPGKAAISQSPYYVRRCPLNCPRPVDSDWFAPLRPERWTPNSSALPQSPTVPGPTTPSRIPVARSRAASDPVPEIHHNLHPSSSFWDATRQIDLNTSKNGLQNRWISDRLRPGRRRVVYREPYQR